MSLEREMLTLFQDMGEYKELLENSLMLCADVYFDLEIKDKNVMTDSSNRIKSDFYRNLITEYTP